MQQVPFAPYRRGPATSTPPGDWGATLFGGENLFGLRHVGSVVANENTGRFYEAGPPATVSVGIKLAGWSTSDVVPD